MFGAGEGPSDVCKGLKGRDLAYCREGVDSCVAQQTPTAGPENPFQLKSCAGDVFTFSKLDGCVNNVPWLIEQRGSCPSSASVAKLEFSSADDTGECDKYTGKKKDYCMEQVGACLDYKDKFSSETPISLETCNRGYFNFSSLLNCFSGVHFLIEQIGVCPAKKKKEAHKAAPKPAPAVSAPPASPAVPEAPAPVLKTSIARLTPSNGLEKIDGLVRVFVAHSLDDKQVIEYLNKMNPPEAGDFTTGRMVAVDSHTKDGRAILKKLGLKAPPPEQKVVRYDIDGKFQFKGKLDGPMPIEGMPASPAEYVNYYNETSDEFGIVYVNKNNFGAQFAKNKGPAIVIAGNPADADEFAITKKLAKLREDPAFTDALPRIIWISTGDEGGVKLADRIGIKPDAAGTAAFYVSEKNGKWEAHPYSEPVIVTTEKEVEDYVHGVSENVLLVISAGGAGRGADKSAALRKELFRAHTKGDLMLKGQKIDRIALISINDVSKVFGGGTSPTSAKIITDKLSELSSLPHAFLFSGYYRRRPEWISPGELPGDIRPEAILNIPAETPARPAVRYKEVTLVNYKTIFNGNRRAHLVMVHSLADKRNADYVNTIPGSQPVAVINWSNPDALKIARSLGLPPLSPGAQYAHYNLTGRITAGGDFEGSRHEIITNYFADIEPARFYGQTPDGWGFVHVDGDNFDERFKQGLQEAVVVVGSATDERSAELAGQLADERDALGLKTSYIWISPDSEKAGEVFKKLGINRGKDAKGIGVFRVRPAGASWRAVSYTPVAEIANPADVTRYIGTTSERVLIIVGRRTGFGAGETDKLAKAVMQANREDALKIGGKVVDRVVVIKDFPRVHGRLAELDLVLSRNIVNQVCAGTHRVQAFVISGKANARKLDPVPLNLLPGGVKPDDVSAEGIAFSPPEAAPQFQTFDPAKKSDMAKLNAIASGVIMIAVWNEVSLPGMLDGLRQAAERDEINVPVFGIKTAGYLGTLSAKELFHGEDGRPLKEDTTYTCQRKEKEKSWTCVEY